MQGLEARRSGCFALVLSDVHMPEMDGYALAGAIRTEERARGWPRTPVVALTASALHKIKGAAGIVGAVELAEPAGELEAAGPAGDWSALWPLVSGVERAVEHLRLYAAERFGAPVA